MDTLDDNPELHGLVLAAGGSGRLGQPKQLLEKKQETLLHRVGRQLLKVTPQVTVVLGADAARMQEAIADLPVIRIVNPDWRSGLATSIRAGVMALPVTADGVLIAVCDQVALETADYQRLAAAWQQAPATRVAATYAGIHGVPAILPRDDFARLLALDGDQGARALLNESGDSVTGLAMPAAETDIDTPADRQQVLSAR